MTIIPRPRTAVEKIDDQLATALADPWGNPDDQVDRITALLDLRSRVEHRTSACGRHGHVWVAEDSITSVKRS